VAIASGGMKLGIQNVPNAKMDKVSGKWDVDQVGFSYESNLGVVMTVPSTIYSSLVVSVGSCTWSEIGCWTQLVG